MAETSTPTDPGAPRRDGRLAQPTHERERVPPVGTTRARGSSRAARAGRAASPRDDAECSFGTDEEIDEIHVWRGEVAGRELRHVRHPVARDDDAHRAVRRAQLEVSLRVRLA